MYNMYNWHKLNYNNEIIKNYINNWYLKKNMDKIIANKDTVNFVNSIKIDYMVCFEYKIRKCKIVINIGKYDKAYIYPRIEKKIHNNKKSQTIKDENVIENLDIFLDFVNNIKEYDYEYVNISPNPKIKDTHIFIEEYEKERRELSEIIKKLKNSLRMKKYNDKKKSKSF